MWEDESSSFAVSGRCSFSVVLVVVLFCVKTDFGTEESGGKDSCMSNDWEISRVWVIIGTFWDELFLAACAKVWFCEVFCWLAGFLCCLCGQEAMV